MNSIFMSDPFRQYFAEEASRSGMKEIKSYATDERRRRIWEKFREDNKRLSIEFLGKDADLFQAQIKRGTVSVGATEQSLRDITNIRSWKLTAPLRRINKFLKKL